MTNESDYRNLSALNEAYGEVQLAIDLLHAKLERLVEAAFERPDRALRQMIRLIHGYGAEAVIHLLEDRGWLPRSHYFGFLRGHLFARVARVAAHRALIEVPAALRDRDALVLKRDELLRARRAVLERLDDNRLANGRVETDADREAGRHR